MTKTDTTTNDGSATEVSPAAVKAALVAVLGDRSKAIKILDGMDEAVIGAELEKVDAKIAALKNAADTLRGLARMASVLKHGKKKRVMKARNKTKGPSGDEDAGDGPRVTTGSMVERIAKYLRVAGPSSPAAISDGVGSSAQYVGQVMTNHPERFGKTTFGKYALK